MVVFSLEEKRIIHKWNINVDEKTQLNVVEMVLLPDYTVLCICNKGYIQIHGFSSNRLRLF